MSASDQFMATNVVLVVTFQFVLRFLAQVATNNRFLTLFYGVLNSLVVYSYFEKGCRRKMCTQQSRKVIWDMINTLFLIL